MFRHRRLHGRQVRDLVPFGSGVRAAEFRAAIRACGRSMMFHMDTCCGRDQGSHPFGMARLPTPLAIRLRPGRFDRLLKGHMTRWRQRGIPRVHPQPAFEFLNPLLHLFHLLDQQNAARPRSRATLVSRLLRNRLRFDQRSVAHAPSLNNVPISGKTNL